MANACTDPVFAPSDAGNDGGADAASLSEGQRTEPDAGGSKPPTEPHCNGLLCPDDSGVASLTRGDASLDEAGLEPLPDAGLDEVRKKWAGRYAARSTLFSYDDPLIKNSAKLLSIVAIVPTAEGGLRLEEEMCFYEGTWSFLVTGHLQYVFNNTRGSGALSYDKDNFDSELFTLRVGYGPTPDGCRPGATLRKSDEQVWLTSTCDCPRNDDTPTSARDCRVTDQERDQKAGATFQASIDKQTIAYRTTQQERVSLRKGYRLGDRLYADRFFEDTTNILDCTVDGTVMPTASCPSGMPKNCPSKYNKVELVRLEDPSHSCEQVIAQEQGLFLSIPPTFPQACPSELAGN